MPYGIICCTYHQLKYSSRNHSNKQKDKSRRSENGGLGKKLSGEWAKTVKAEKDKTKSERTRQKNMRGNIEKWDQTDSLRFQTGERHQKSPGLPSGADQVNFLPMLEGEEP